MKRLLLPFLLLLAAAGGAAAQNTYDPRDVTANTQSKDWESRNADETGVVLPVLPKNENLIEFWVSNSTAFRFFIDTVSLSVDREGVVRYTLVARSPSGFANISYEGMRCSAATYKIYAYERDGRWSPATSEWRAIEPNAIQRWHNELRNRYFCVERRGALLSREEGLDALRRGGHPGAAGRAGY